LLLEPHLEPHQGRPVHVLQLHALAQCLLEYTTHLYTRFRRL
jgi:hypothetical protein